MMVPWDHQTLTSLMAERSWSAHKLILALIEDDSRELDMKAF